MNKSVEIPKIGCVQHDCDACVAAAKQNTRDDFFLISHNGAHDIGTHASRAECEKSDAYYNMGGGRFTGLLLVNRAGAHEIMRRLKLELSHYDNSELKQ